MWIRITKPGISVRQQSHIISINRYIPIEVHKFAKLIKSKIKESRESRESGGWVKKKEIIWTGRCRIK